ncbi:TRAP transporter small permease [Nitratireductor thuwali]|uniref:TRAP transporter small permease subunit n=1 Tax=Nitratireductor thuwali TaxID=2267699 RepID=UPI0030D31CF4
MRDDDLPDVEAVLEQEVAAPLPEAGRLGRLIDRGGIVFAIGIVLAMLILIQEVILRYFFNAPTIWAHETTVFLAAIAFLYGGLYCTVRNSHIRVVLLYDLVQGRARRVLDAAISLVCMIATGFFAWAAWLMVQRAIFRPDGSVRFETSGSAWDPAYPAYLKLFLLAVLALMALQFMILAFNFARAALARHPETT